VRQHRFDAVFDRFAPFSGRHDAEKTLVGQDVIPIRARKPRLKTAKTVLTAEK